MQASSAFSASSASTSAGKATTPGANVVSATSSSSSFRGAGAQIYSSIESGGAAHRLHSASVSRRLVMTTPSQSKLAFTTPQGVAAQDNTPGTSERQKQEALELAKAEWSESRRLMREVVERHHEDMRKADEQLKASNAALAEQKGRTRSSEIRVSELERQIAQLEVNLREARTSAQTAEAERVSVEEALKDATNALREDKVLSLDRDAQEGESEELRRRNKELRDELEKKTQELNDMSDAVDDARARVRRRTSSARSCAVGRASQDGRKVIIFIASASLAIGPLPQIRGGDTARAA